MKWPEDFVNQIILGDCIELDNKYHFAIIE